MNRAQAIQEYNKTVATLLADLDQLGVKYKATDRHENHHTNVKVTRKKKYCFRNLNITNRILGSKPGDVLEFPAGSYPLVNLQSTITAKANRILGPGRYRTGQSRTHPTSACDCTCMALRLTAALRKSCNPSKVRCNERTRHTLSIQLGTVAQLHSCPTVRGAVRGA